MDKMNSTKKVFDLSESSQKSSELLNHFFTYNPIIMAVLDSNGVFKSVNSKFISKLKYKSEEIIDKEINVIANDINLPEINYFLKTKPNGIWKSDIIAKDKEGENLFLSAEITLIKDNSSNFIDFLFSAEDKTEYKKIKVKLDERSLRIDSIFKAFPDKLFLMNYEGIIKDYYIADQENLFIPPTEFLGQNFYEILPPIAANSLLVAFKKAKETHSISTYEYSVNIKNEERYYEGRLVPYENGEILNIVRNISDKKKAEDEIQLLISALEAADNSVVITEKEGKIIWVNKAFENLTGYTLSEAKGQNPRILKSGLNDKEVYQKLWDKIKSGQSWFGHLYNKRKDGTIYLDEQTITPIFNNNGQIINFIAIKNDLTIQKKLEEQQDLHLGLWNLITDAVVVTDKDFKINLWNKGAENLYGWKFNEVHKKDISEFINSNNPNSYTENIFKKLIETGEVKTESIQKNKKEEKLWIDSTVSAIWDSEKNVIGYICLNRDITDKMKMVEEISNDRELLKSIFDSTADCILVIDKNKRIVMFNNAALDYLELPKKQIIYKEISYVMKDYKKIGNMWDGRINEILNGQQLKRFEDSDNVKDAIRYIKSVFFPIFDSVGNVNFAGIIFSDITVEKLVEENYLETERLTTIGKMATYISHEMKTPLNSINMNIDILKNTLQLPPLRQRSFDIIQKEVKRLSHLMKDVLQFSKYDNLNGLETSICQIINNIKILVEPILNKKDIIFINKVEDVKVHFNPEKLESAFIQLIENSIDAVSTGGEIIMYSKKDADMKHLFVFIKDNGYGIKEPDKIFQPFYTTKKDGTGLGMSIIKNILIQNNGDIALLSSKEGETIFKLIFNI